MGLQSRFQTPTNVQIGHFYKKQTLSVQFYNWMESWVVSRQEDLTEVKDNDREQEGNNRQIPLFKNIIESS